jgi:hypothetical protein
VGLGGHSYGRLTMQTDCGGEGPVRHQAAGVHHGFGGRVGGMAARSDAASKFGRLDENLDFQEGKEWVLWNSEAKTAISLS